MDSRGEGHGGRSSRRLRTAKPVVVEPDEGESPDVLRKYLPPGVIKEYMSLKAPGNNI